ncbi:hypothetical protein Scep_007243 [Stephania cephalantha]|uniref:Uncharacterized protein n=1 Tax=Stephania cephalantha TaxID=152367 RepID=A0AAP0K9M5_9MAGN
MIEGRAGFYFTEPVGYSLTSLLFPSPGTSAAAQDRGKDKGTDDGQWHAQIKRQMTEMIENYRNTIEDMSVAQERMMIEMMDVIKGYRAPLAPPQMQPPPQPYVPP